MLISPLKQKVGCADVDGNVEEDGDEVGIGLVDGWMLVLGEIDRDGWRVGRNDGTWLGATDCDG